MNALGTNDQESKLKLELAELDVLHLKTSEQKLKQEIVTLNSKLDDERHRNNRLENLLQLRFEYIKTLQDTDEVNKDRFNLQTKEVESLRIKNNNMKKLRAASKEELSNLCNTLKSQEYEIQRLKKKLETSNEQLTTFKSTMNASGDKL